MYKLQFGNCPRNKSRSPQGVFAACPLPQVGHPRSWRLSESCRCFIAFREKSDENRAKCDCIACCSRLWRVVTTLRSPSRSPTRSWLKGRSRAGRRRDRRDDFAGLAPFTVGRVRRQEGNRIERLSPRGVAEINNPCKCFPMSAHPAFELGGRNLSSPRPGEHRGSAGFSRTAPSDPNSAAICALPDGAGARLPFPPLSWARAANPRLTATRNIAADVDRIMT